MKALIAVMSCHSRPSFRQTIRDTWAPLVPKNSQMLFFLGRGVTASQPDEIVLDCEDGYYDIPDKVRSMVRWALDRGYDYILKCDDDVVLFPVQVLQSDFCKYDFTGCQDPAVKTGEINTPWGFCYWLSSRAMKLVASAPLPGEPKSTHTYKHNNDEAWVSTILYLNNIYLHADDRYFLHRGKLPVEPAAVPKGRRSLRPNRLNLGVTEAQPVHDAFAFCIYLNWKGWHATPDEELHDEFRKVFFREVVKLNSMPLEGGK
jgi:Galactosyltransferase